MEQQRLPFGLRKVLDGLGWLEQRLTIPVVVPGSTLEFARSLFASTAEGSPLFEFVSGLSFSGLDDELIKSATTAQVSQQLLGLMLEYNKFAVEMEKAVAERNFKLAARWRDRRYEIRERIAELVPEPIRIMPNHLMEALNALGYDGPLPTQDEVSGG